MSNKIITKEDEIKIIESYIVGMSANKINIEILKNKFKTKKSIFDVLKKYNIKTRNGGSQNLTKNHNYFSIINTQEKAYFLGIMQSDGWITKRKDAERYSVGLSLTDEEIVQKFKEEIDSDVKITKRRKEDFHKYQYQIVVDSPVLYTDLYNLGVNDKFKDQYVPGNINDDLLRHYIRGLFDGDGCVCNKGVNQAYFLGGFKSMSQLSYILCNKFKLKQRDPKMINDCGLYKLNVCNIEDIKRLYDLLYKDATIYMNRKSKIFKEILNG